MILPGSDSQEFAATLSSVTGEPIGQVEYGRFPDGEQIVQIPEPENRAIVVSSTLSDKSHIELLQLQDAAREVGVRELITVIPYLGYARQDKAFEPGQPVSARAMARAISTGTDQVITVNPHEQSVLEYFDVPAKSVDASSYLSQGLPSMDDPLFIGPDESAIDLAEGVRDAYGFGDVDYFEKVRLSGDDVEITPHHTTASNRNVVIVDDIVATGSTMSRAIEALQSPAKIVVACIHPLLAGNARTKLARAGVEQIIATDTIDRSVSSVSAAVPVAESL
ncbi:MAG: ribose-phosphate diphosphokinase [Halobacteriaceae archaeon]